MAKKPLRDAFDRYAAPAPSGTEMDTARLLPLAKVALNATQARQHFGEGALDELTASVREFGVLEPILVRPVAAGYEILAGERRYRAASAAGLTEIPAIVYEALTDTQAAFITATENLQREDLDPEDEARQFAALLAQSGLSVRALAEKLGRGERYIGRRVRLLEKAPHLFAAIRAGQITLLAALDSIKDAATTEDDKMRLGDAFSTEGSSVRLGDAATEVLVNGHVVAAPPAEAAPPPRLSRAQLDPPGSTPRYRPVYSFQSWVRLIQPAKVSPAEKPVLRAELVATIKLAQEALAALGPEE